MRDRRFVAQHRGGPLQREQHIQLMLWACSCAKHILPLFGKKMDERLPQALRVAKAWTKAKATVGDARKAAWAAHAVANAATNPAAVAVARAVGHAVATAHMADHALGPAWYALKAVNSAGRSSIRERKWQDEHLPAEIRELVLSARLKRGI